MSSQTEVLVLRFTPGYAGEKQAQRKLAEWIDKGYEIVAFAIDPKGLHLVYTLVKRNTPEAD